MVAVTATLIGSAEPKPVQVVITGLTVGWGVSVYATWAGGGIRAVRGALSFTAADTQVVLIDVLTPVNTPVTYLVYTTGASMVSSAPVTVAFSSDSLLQSLDGEVVAGFEWMDNADPKAPTLRTEFFQVAGRTRPVMRHDVSIDDAGTIIAETSGAQTTAMLALVSAGAPVVWRTELGLRDVAAVEVVGLRDLGPRVLIGAAGDLRSWSLGYQLLDDPDAADVLTLATFEDFDTVYAGLTFAAFDAEWSGQTFADFDVEDWRGRSGL